MYGKISVHSLYVFFYTLLFREITSQFVLVQFIEEFPALLLGYTFLSPLFKNYLVRKLYFTNHNKHQLYATFFPYPFFR